MLSLSPSSPTREEEAQFHMARESSAHKKTPTRNGRGQPIQAAVPFPRKDVSALCRAGLLACGSYLLSAPSQGDAPQWSLQISFRSQLRGSEGIPPSSLVTAPMPVTTQLSFRIPITRRFYSHAPASVKHRLPPPSQGRRSDSTPLKILAEAYGSRTHRRRD